MIELIESTVLYENPKPHVHSRHGYFPGIVRLDSGEMICLFVLAEAFEAPNGTTWISRSADNGRTWKLQGRLYDKSVLPVETTDTLKAVRLRDGSLVATGYRYFRHDLEEGIAIEATGGIQPGEVVVTHSRDGGRTWDVPSAIPRSWPEVLELSGPAIETASGDLLGVAAPMKMPDGTNPSGQIGMLLRSRDKGRTWDDRTAFFRTAKGDITPLESRLCEMQPGRIVVLSWAYDYDAQQHRANHITVSHDNGATWFAPVDTGVWGQASSLIHAGGDRLLTIHAHRGPEYGVFVRAIAFAGDEFRIAEEFLVWNGTPMQGGAPGMVKMFQALRFGQPSLLHLEGDEYLAYHWAIEEGQGRIRQHRLRIRV